MQSFDSQGSQSSQLSMLCRTSHLTLALDHAAEVIHSMGSRTVVRYGKDKVIKSGRLNVNEADTLRFVAANTSIPVPRVHEVRHSAEGCKSAIVMDYMPGIPLEEAWKSFSHDQKIAVTREIGAYVSQLRCLKGSYIGGVNRGKVTVGRHDRVYGGPFENEKLFNEFLRSMIVKGAPSTLRHYAGACLKEDHEIVFTHADLAPRNILVDEHGRVSAILDWEDAGWYPEYWEHYRALRDLRPMPDWPEYFHYMLPQSYEAEFINQAPLED
ncbi:hypothetical protein PRK78_004504 [Emydomyces testavorans]|uniref:Aminoglycoside phosphotransferase domain-containing protein n=1 Tax=Emydomyces testavorans TaxID=2070801 RepID=A0AAF0IJU3_9EURO|nr:hypothetical protein PRK78_004504 [Emydomyces testavorans]